MDNRVADYMRRSFEAGLSGRVERASRIKIHPFIPSHWFASAASECQDMFVAGYFYGAISAAQVTVDALARFLCERCTVPGKRKDVKRIWRELAKAGEVSAEVREAALCIYRDRDDYHHLRGTVEQDYNSLEARATDCINKLYAIESEVFAG